METFEDTQPWVILERFESDKPKATHFRPQKLQTIKLDACLHTFAWQRRHAVHDKCVVMD
jgi:hypothetical protein